MSANDCDRQDFVLARFLDGDPDETRCAEFELTAHLEGCSSCLEALQHARRLDAAIARHSAVEVPSDVADRLLCDAVKPGPEAPATSTANSAGLSAGLSAGPGRSLAGAVWLLLLCGISGVGVGVGLAVSTGLTADRPALSIRSAVSVPGAGQEEPAGGEQPGLRQDAILLPGAGRRSGPPSPAHHAPKSPTELLKSEDLARDLLPGMILVRGLRDLLVPAPMRDPGSWAAIPAVADHLANRIRCDAGETLMRSRRTRDRSRFLGFLAESRDDEVLAHLLSISRKHAPTTRHLLRRLTSGDPGFSSRGAVSRLGQPPAQALRAAARLGHPTIDREILRIVRREPSHAHSIATDACSVTERPNRIALLLDLWDALRRRGPVSADEIVKIESWFLALPRSATSELLHLAENAGSSDRRIRCLAALSARRDPLALSGLLRLVESHRQESALAAGHALSRLPRDRAAEEIAGQVRRSRRPHILLAALCGMDSDQPRKWLETVALTKEEAEFLFSGRFTKTQFGIACDLCRRRSRITY